MYLCEYYEHLKAQPLYDMTRQETKEKTKKFKKITQLEKKWDKV